ncbi:MAG: hypothetical protein GWO24_27770 [Akkermansiaceae bacterium]|nr:hypothetical protein [Akkermansiaceae bacterium]
MKWAREREHTAARQADFRTRSKPSGASFHTCANCGATDLSHPDRDFRITEDERELCDTCLASETDQPDTAEKTT